MSRKIIVCFSGWKGSGKDSCCDILEDLLKDTYEIRRKSCADFIREVIYTIFGIKNPEYDSKEKPLKETKLFYKKEKSYRDLLIEIGEGLKKIVAPDVWTHAIEKDIYNFFSGNKNKLYIIPDIRYNTELKLLSKLRKKGYEVHHFFVIRKEKIPEWFSLGLNPSQNEDLEIIRKDFGVDRSEYEWFASSPKYESLIKNDGSLDDLKENIKNLLGKV